MPDFTSLSDVSTLPPDDADRARAKKQAKAFGSVIGELVEQFAAVQSHALLVIFQGMDASGKDGAVRAAFGRCTPAPLRVHAFKAPTPLERRHDFLWRVHQQAPAKGQVAIWNRSHYEDVLIQRVHGWIDEAKVDARFAAINAFERNLQRDNNTIILKFLLHTSEEEQREQLMERLIERDKNYKHNAGDWAEREHWDEYRAAYDDVLRRSEVPWTIVPTDKRWWRDFIVAQAVKDALEGLGMEWPALPQGESAGKYRS